MINLIPPAAKKNLRREYWLRVFSVWLALTGVALLAGASILLPAYVLIDSQIAAYASSAHDAKVTVTSFEQSAAELTEANTRATQILAAASSTAASTYLRAVSDVAGPEIVISELVFQRTVDGVSPLRLTAVANNRQALSDFRDQLLTLPLVAAVDFPFDNLAQEEDIIFTLTIDLVAPPENV